MSDGSELLTKLLSSEIKTDLLVLFHKNPGLIDTVDGVARRIGKTAATVESDLKYLLELGILKRKKVGSLEVILLDHARDKEVQDTVEKHLRSLKI